MPAATVDLLFQILVYKQCQKTSEEVRLDAVVPSCIDRSCLKVGFHNTEAVFNDPSTAIQFDDDGGRILKNRTQGVKTVEACFLVYHLLIEGKIFNLSKFPVRGAMLGFNEALRVIRALALGCRSLTLCQQGHCTSLEFQI